MLKGFQRINPSKDSRTPITLQMLQAFPVALKMLHFPLMKHFSFQQPFPLPFFFFFFFGFLRIGEIIATGNSGDNSRIIHVSDVVVNDENVKITLRVSKTDQYGESATLVFYPSQQKHICPVSLIKKVSSS